MSIITQSDKQYREEIERHYNHDDTLAEIGRRIDAQRAQYQEWLQKVSKLTPSR